MKQAPHESPLSRADAGRERGAPREVRSPDVREQMIAMTDQRFADQRETPEPESFTRSEVTARGFEARCVVDGVEYLWHHGYGLRVDHDTRTAVLITDPERLPEGPWQATELGLVELGDPGLRVLDPRDDDRE